MKVPIGGGKIPGGACWWATEDKIYWDNGDITPNADDGLFWRCSYTGSLLAENFSLWTDEQRRAVKEEVNRAISEEEQRQAESDERELAMLISIRAKLSDDEWNYMKSEFEYTPDCGWPDEPEGGP